MNSPLQNLRELLSEDVSCVQMRERTTFDFQAAPFADSIVLFGAGKLGRQILRGLRSLGIEPMAFCDNNSGLWEKSIDGLQVFSPAEAVHAFGRRAVFVLSIWSDVIGHPLAEVTLQLQSHGPVKVVSFIPLYWKFPTAFLPYFSLDLPHKIILQKETVLQTATLWGDALSQQEYFGQLLWRLRLDFSGVADPCLDNPFFQADLIAEKADEVFVDCGAYDGDTLRVLLQQDVRRFKRIVALEPDPSNYAKLCAYIESLDREIQARITTFPLAVGAARETLRFAGLGTEQSKLSAAGTLEIQCTTLDDLLADASPTYVKMDIEGAEPGAIKGARSIIQKNMPVLAISAYHEPDHLWRLPWMIHELASEYTFALRPQAQAAWDLICYAIPPARKLAN